MCRGLSSALLLALCFVAPSWSDGGFLMDQSAKDESLRILNELESNLTTLREALQKATDSSSRLDEDLRLSLLKLANSEKLLREASLNLQASEDNLAVVKALLTQASQALQSSEQSFKDYQKSEFGRLLLTGGGGFALGVISVVIFNAVKR